MEIDKYICKQLNFKGGGCWTKNKLGLIQVDYCASESKLKVLWVNVKLFVMWILKIY